MKCGDDKNKYKCTYIYTDKRDEKAKIYFIKAGKWIAYHISYMYDVKASDIKCVSWRKQKKRIIIFLCIIRFLQTKQTRANVK